MSTFYSTTSVPRDKGLSGGVRAPQTDGYLMGQMREKAGEWL